jgi:hypothetical protein
VRSLCGNHFTLEGAMEGFLDIAVEVVDVVGEKWW